MKKTPIIEKQEKELWIVTPLIELGIAEKAWLNLEIKLISLELCLHNRMQLDRQKSTADLCNELKELRETFYNEFHWFAEDLRNNDSEKHMCKSESQVLDEIIN